MDGVNPPFPSLLAHRNCPGWSCTKTAALNSVTAAGGLSSPSSPTMKQTSPHLGMFSLGSPLTLIPTLSPGPALATDLWCISMEKSFPSTPVGANPTVQPGFNVPCSIRPVITSPTPLILYTPETGIRIGFLDGRLGQWTTSFRASRRVTPSTSFFFGLTLNPLYQSMLVEASMRLSPWNPDIGTNGIFLVLKPILVSIFLTSRSISLNRSSLYPFGTVLSILLTPTITCSTPKRWRRRACCRVCP